MSRITDYELSHLILRFEQEKDMKPMHCVQNLGALRDLVSARIDIAGLKAEKAELLEAAKVALESLRAWNAMSFGWANPDMKEAVIKAYEASPEIQGLLKAIAKAESSPQ
jgi:hypothetical protein